MKNIWWAGPFDKPGELESIKTSLKKCFPDHEVLPRYNASADIASHLADAISDSDCDIIAIPEDRIVTVEELRSAKAVDIRLIRMRRNIVSTIFVIDRETGDANLQYGKDRIEWQYIDRVVKRNHGASQITVEINGAMVKHHKRAK